MKIVRKSRFVKGRKKPLTYNTFAISLSRRDLQILNALASTGSTHGICTDPVGKTVYSIYVEQE